MVGSRTPWKVIDPSPMTSTVWLSCVRERRGYMQGGLILGASTLGVGTEAGHGGTLSVSLGGTLRGGLG